MKNCSSIDTDDILYKIVAEAVSTGVVNISGIVCTQGERPDDSETEDIVINTITVTHDKPQTGCISSVSYIKPQPIISNKLYTNILLILFIIKNGRVGFVSIAKILKKLQLNRFADDFFCDFA